MGHSIVYDHILAIVNTESRRFSQGSTVRILDAGCGNGLLMRWLRDQLPRLHPGRFRAHSAALGVGLDQFAEQHADFILFFTRYMRSSDALRLARRHNLGASWRFTRDLYGRKLGSVSRRRPSYVYDSNRSA